MLVLSERLKEGHFSQQRILKGLKGGSFCGIIKKFGILR